MVSPVKSTGDSSAIGPNIVTPPDSSSSSVLSALPADVSESTKDTQAKKRARESNGSAVSKAAKKVKPNDDANGDQQEKATYCHQCRAKCKDEYLRCTKLRKRPGQTEPTACNLAFCRSDLTRKYDTSVSAIEARGVLAGAGDVHDSSSGYTWTCPHCLDQCHASQCRRKRGLEPLGSAPGQSPHAPKAPKTNGTAPAITAKQANGSIQSKNSLTPPPDLPVVANGPRPLSTTKKARPSHVFTLSDGSDLSDLDGPADVKPNGTTSSGKKKPADKAAAKKPKKKVDTPQSASKKAAGAKDAKGNKSKAKADGAAAKEKKPKPKPEKKPEVPVEPPVFEKVDTRLGREEAEQRIMLREYLVRFRAVLSLPERALPPLDDFDRPISEASVRIFFGAMLDLIKEDLEKDGLNEDVMEMVDQHREELRYFADLARVANAFKNLTTPLGLKMPSAVTPTARGGANAQAIRALLDLDDDASPPAWADVGPSRRTAASRLPQPNEVVRMLLALAERTLSTPSIRTDLAWEAPENEARRVHLRQYKKENDKWDARKKKLAEARVLCKTAAATKANKEEFTKENKEHSMNLALANVNLRAALGQRALRPEPLGVDLDGRTYWVLNIRPVDDDTRPPVAWGSGLLVWGIGLPPKPNVPHDEDELPMLVERWCHFGKSADVRQLAKWIEYRTKKAVEAARGAKPKTPSKSKAKSSATPNGSSTPSKLKQTPLAFANGNGSPASRPTPKRKSTLEVVIPVHPSKRPADEVDEDDDDNGSSTSELSDITTDETAELLAQVAPEGYKPSPETIDEEGKELARKVAEVAEWLEVLEWKGLGEV